MRVPDRVITFDSDHRGGRVGSSAVTIGRRTQVWIVAIAGAAVLVFSVYVLVRQPTDDASANEGATSIQDTSAPTPTAEATSTCPAVGSSRPLSLRRGQTVAVLGDSFTVGQAADPETKGYAYQVADKFGWTLKNFGVRLNGYASRSWSSALSRSPTLQCWPA